MTMAKKNCEICESGTMPVPIVLADDERGRVIWAHYCPMCGRCLKEANG